ncbi:hypothetical protein D3C71_1909730 [compost metagenome]
MFEQRAQGIEHVLVAQVPRRFGVAVDGPVVLLGGAHHPGVLGRIEKGLVIFDEMAQALAQQRIQLLHHHLFAGHFAKPLDEVAV